MASLFAIESGREAALGGRASPLFGLGSYGASRIDTMDRQAVQSLDG